MKTENKDKLAAKAVKLFPTLKNSPAPWLVASPVHDELESPLREVVKTMRQIWIAMFILVVSMCASGQDCKDAIAKVRDAWVTAWKAQKIDDVMKLYAPNATVLAVDGRVYVGPAEIRDYLKALMNPRATVESAEVVCSDATGYDTGTYSTPGGGFQMQGNGQFQGNVQIQAGAATHDKYVVTLRKDSPTWLIVQTAGVKAE